MIWRDCRLHNLILLAILISLGIPQPATAQGEYRAVLSKPDVHSFPRVMTYLKIYQPDGAFIHGLDSQSIWVLEDGKSIPLAEVQEIRVGLQTSVVINAGPGFASRNTKGMTRYDVMKDYLQAWADDQKEIDIDHLSLYTNGGLTQTDLTSSQAWLTALLTYQPDLKNAVSSLEPLNEAIQAAGDSTGDPLTQRAIFYITSLPGMEMTEAVREDLISRAQDADVPIFIWMLASRSDFDSPAAGHLRIIAEKTGGQFFAFSGAESLPEAQSLLEPLRYQYRLDYSSRVQSGGNHNLGVRVELQDTTVTSDPVVYSIDLQPVQPIFVGLPAEIQRMLQRDNGLTPDSVLVEFLVEYPDQIHRDLKSSRLLVDGAEVAKNTAPPYTQFYWDLSGYTVTGSHTLQVEVTDALGITSLSTLLPVEIQVPTEQPTAWDRFIQSGGLYVLFLVIFVAGVAAAMLVLRFRGGKPAPAEKEKENPASAALFEQSIGAPKVSARPAPFPSRQAFLQPLNADLEPLHDCILEGKETPVPLGDLPITWGNDPRRVTLFIDHPGVEAVHCRVFPGEDGRYHLEDLGTQAGTWLNFEPVLPQGTVLTHGDILMIGENYYQYLENPVTLSNVLEVLPYNNIR